MTLDLASSVGDRSLAARLWIVAAVVRILKYALPFPRVVALAARPVVRRTSAARVARLRRLADARSNGPRLPGNCLERSLGLFRLLIAAGAAPELAVGVTRGTARLIDGHVWVLLDGIPLGETAATLAPFERLLEFDARGRFVAPAASRHRTAS